MIMPKKSLPIPIKVFEMIEVVFLHIQTQALMIPQE